MTLKIHRLLCDNFWLLISYEHKYLKLFRRFFQRKKTLLFIYQALYMCINKVLRKDTSKKNFTWFSAQCTESNSCEAKPILFVWIFLSCTQMLLMFLHDNVLRLSPFCHFSVHTLNSSRPETSWTLLPLCLAVKCYVIKLEPLS